MRDAGMRVVAVLLACTACGSSSGGGNFVAEDFSQSGSRLKMHWLVAGDARTPQLTNEGFTVDIRSTESRFYDADLGFECSPKEWDDGAMYCTPGSPNGSSLLGMWPVDDDLVFRDPACTQPALIIEQSPGACLTEPIFAKLEYGGAIRGLATLGAPTTDSQYYQLHSYTAGPACQGPMPLRSGAQIYEAARVFQRSELVPITLGFPLGDTGRLQWQYIESPDGLVAPGVIYDEKLERTCGIDATDSTKKPCRYARNPDDPLSDNRLATVSLRPSSDASLSPTLVESDETRLPLGGLFYDRTVDLAIRPVGTADGMYRAATRYSAPTPMFEDSACTIPIDLVTQNTGSARIDHVVTSSCSVIDHVYDVGPKAAQPYVYSQPQYPTPPSCVPFSGSAYRIGGEVSFDALGPAVTLETD